MSMPKKAVSLFTLLMLAACFMSYKLGSTPVAMAKASPQENAAALPPPTLPAAPATWTLTKEMGTAGTPGASVSRPAGGTGVKHVATCISVSIGLNPSAPSPEGELVVLRDGASGTGTILFQTYSLLQPGQVFAQSVCDLNIVGSSNTSMTLEFESNTTYLTETVNLVGYDAQ
jgi:hypothetical protein